MYEKYLSKKFDVKNFDCCHLASEFLNDNFVINTSIIDNYPRIYTKNTAYFHIIDAFIKNGFVEVMDGYQKGDIIITKNPYGCCYVCVDDKTALTIQKQVQIFELDVVNHLRHRSLL